MLIVSVNLVKTGQAIFFVPFFYVILNDQTFFFSSSSNGSSTIVIHKDKDKWTTSVEIERNDSGLGSETGGKSGNKRPIPIKKLNNNKLNNHDQIICEDCDQLIDVNSEVGKR